MNEGTITQKREIPVSQFGLQPVPWDSAGTTSAMGVNVPFEGATPVVGGYGFPALSQVTTSFRSGRSALGKISARQELQEFISESQRAFNTPYDNGHEFSTIKEDLSVSRPFVRLTNGRTGASYQGPLLPYPLLNDFSSSFRNPVHSFPAINLGQGTKFLNQVRPTKAAANVAQALLELIVDLPKIPFKELAAVKELGKLPRASGEEYLNFQFGWAPLVNDVLKTCKALVNANKILDQYRRDSGKNIRRRAHLPVATTTSSADLGRQWTCVGDAQSYNTKQLFDDVFDDKGNCTTVDKSTEEYSLSAAFSYLVTGDETFFGKMAEYGRYANRLLGTRIDLSTLWEIAPWSWLADWWGDIGDIISLNSSIANDNLVIRYGYLMRHSTLERTYVHSGIRVGSRPTGAFTATYKVSQKERVRATPYGFGLDLSSLTEYQWSILGALGLTKGDRKMWWG